MSSQRESAAVSVPTKFRRVGKRGFTWGLPRSFPGYFSDTTKQVLGAATKYVIRTNEPQDPEYLVKYAQKQHGSRETYTEFFINQLGATLGFRMAHSGLVLLDGTLAFITRIFTSGEETLRHGSLIIEDYFKDEQLKDAHELDNVHRREEQSFYSIDFVANLLGAFCGEDFAALFPDFIEMLVFDALIGSMDRHGQNWGVVGRTVEPAKYRFAPIFDSARSLLWSLDDTKVERLWRDEGALRSHIDRAKPCMGPVRNHPKVNNCNHFDFITNLLELYPKPATEALLKVSNSVEEKSAKLVHQFPFDRAFSATRKRVIVKMLALRADMLNQILLKGGSP